MDRMTPLDAMFLDLEDEELEVSLAISSAAVFEGPAPSYPEFAEMLAARLPLVPRYRQKVRQIPLDLSTPVWVDDPHFDLTNHLRQVALPKPGGDAELAQVIGDVMSERLDRERPLWEYWLVEGLAEGRWALISKVHHCMVDGVSGTDLYRVILDDQPEGRPVEPDDWRPEPEPGTATLTMGALLSLALNPMSQARMLAWAVQHPKQTLGRIWATARGLGVLSEALAPAEHSSLVGPLTARRRFTWARASMADVKTVRRGLGGTVNDVVLAAITNGFRSLLLARGETPQPHSVRSLVPVSVRAPGDERILDNRVSLMLPFLPVDVSDPVQRLSAVRARLDELKSSMEAESVALISELAQQEPFPLISPAYRLAAHLPQRSIVTVTTNVPGPRRKLYALGRPLVEIIPYVPLAIGFRTGVSIMTYGDRIDFGVTGDYEAATDVEVLARGIEQGVAELVARAVTEKAPEKASEQAGEKANEKAAEKPVSGTVGEKPATGDAVQQPATKAVAKPATGKAVAKPGSKAVEKLATGKAVAKSATGKAVEQPATGKAAGKSASGKSAGSSRNSGSADTGRARTGRSPAPRGNRGRS
jgi:WS/DGAT/MGAT family acyltransferase